MKNLRPYQTLQLLPLSTDSNEKYYPPAMLPLRNMRQDVQQSAVDFTQIVVQTQEAERKKISEELHDNICQTLGAIKLFIDQMLEANKLKRKTIRKCSVYLHEVINELRHVAHDMGMVWLQENSFCTALHKFVNMMQELKKIRIRLHMNGFHDCGMDSHSQLIIFRIIQEQVQNVLKHAHASVIDITLSRSGQHGYLCISDNGIGADIHEATVKEGAGLKNIRHRVEIISGTMEITTSPGNGFVLEVAFPVVEGAPNHPTA